MLKTVIADFACGTGTLLSTLYEILIQNYEMNGNDMKKIHGMMMGDNIHGFDVLPTAAHLTASSLANVFPTIQFKKSKIAAIRMGKYDGRLYLGSLDFITDDSTFDQSGAIIDSDKETPYISGYHNTEFDIIIMNPPFTSNTREGGREGIALFKSFSIDKKTQQEMSKQEKKNFTNTCADGNAGLASHFIAIADKKLKPDGVLGLVLPATVVKGESWKKVRDVIKLKYDNVIVVSIAGPETTDGSFSFDTALNEVLVIAKKVNKIECDEITDIENHLKLLKTEKQRMESILKKRKTKNRIGMNNLKTKQMEIEKYVQQLKKRVNPKRGLFVSLTHPPINSLESFAIYNSILSNRGNVHKQESNHGGMPISIGNKTVGTMLNCPLNLDWNFVNVYDELLMQCALNLSAGMLRPIQNQLVSYNIPMTSLNVNSIGPLTRDITDNKPNDTRAAFTTHSITRKTIYYGLAKNNADVQTTLVVEPDTEGVPKTNATREKINETAKTASRLHINILSRYDSQKLLVLYTKKKTLSTGSSLPNYYIEEKYEKPFAVWGNSTFGILCHWLYAGKQQFGRGIGSRTTLSKMAVLDFDQLTNKQIQKMSKLFDEYSNNTLKPIMNLDKDNTRKSLDSGISGILDIDMSLDDIRKRLVNEPILHGNHIPHMST